MFISLWTFYGFHKPTQLSAFVLDQKFANQPVVIEKWFPLVQPTVHTFKHIEISTTHLENTGRVTFNIFVAFQEKTCKCPQRHVPLVDQTAHLHRSEEFPHGVILHIFPFEMFVHREVFVVYGGEQHFS
jgi:hypothetical protein